MDVRGEYCESETVGLVHVLANHEPSGLGPVLRSTSARARRCARAL